MAEEWRNVPGTVLREFAFSWPDLRRFLRGTADNAGVSTIERDVRIQVLQPTGTPQPTGVARPTSRPISWAPRWTGDGPRFVDELIGWLLSVGRRTYEGRVTLLEHALQSAALAKLHGARESLVVAALLHDIGQPLADVVDADAESHVTDERLAASWLGRFYPEAVTEPIRLQVEAKRWLVATEPGYLATLSLASRAALVDQGGPMPPAECAAFEVHPFACNALVLSRWDEEASVPNAQVAQLETYRPALLRQMKPSR
jgi:predicted HD phosphohydrolase